MLPSLDNYTRKYLENPEKGVIVGQIANLKRRLFLIRWMQISGVSSFFMCVLSMIFIFQELVMWGGYIFGLSLVLLLISLGIMLKELNISTHALEIELSDMEV